MGGLTKSLFGGSSSNSSSNSYNQAYNYLNGALAPSVTAGAGATQDLSSLLTGGGDPSSNPAFQNYLNSTGYKFQTQQGMQGITNNAAVNGTLNSGATLKALDNYNQNAASGAFQNYLGDLSNLAGIGNTAAGTIAGAGQTSTSTGKSGSSGGIIPGLFG